VVSAIMIRRVSYWGKCSSCGMERRVKAGRIIAHRCYDRATDSMITCPGSGYQPSNETGQGVTSVKAGRPLVATAIEGGVSEHA
jgi:hypothetical protein